MTRPQLCSGSTTVKKFLKLGWTVARQKGSHVMMVKKGYAYTLSIPQHKELGIGILRKLIMQADISIEKFNAL
jgi:predicted RNA binding protein YcfA (HicA-like mRNA interferase family)